MELLECHDRALGATRVLVADVPDGRWDASTPCEDWDVRGLVNHIVAGNFWVGELARGRTIDDVGDRLDGDVLDDDPVAAYDSSAKVSSDAFHAPGALEAPCAVSYGPVPGSVYLGHRFIDVLVHGWDLAVATGQPSDLDDDLAQACLDVIAPQMELLSASGMFGESSEAAADAAPGVRLLALLGRQT